MRRGRGRRVVWGVVWKVLAGIEDGLDNGWPLIRADAGSLSVLFLFFSFLFLLRLEYALLCQNVKKMRSSLVLIAYLELT